MDLTTELRDTTLKLSSSIKNGAIQANDKSKGGQKTNKTKGKGKVNTGKNDVSYA